jgi:hypothetical protein
MPRAKQLGWFAVIWMSSVGILAIVGGVIRWVLLG